MTLATLDVGGQHRRPVLYSSESAAACTCPSWTWEESWRASQVFAARYAQSARLSRPRVLTTTSSARGLLDTARALSSPYSQRTSTTPAATRIRVRTSNGASSAKSVPARASGRWRTAHTATSLAARCSSAPGNIPKPPRPGRTCMESAEA